MNSANHSQQIVQKLWNYCNLLRDDGLSYGDYSVLRARCMRAATAAPRDRRPRLAQR